MLESLSVRSPRSSSGLGRSPLKAKTRVRVPYGACKAVTHWVAAFFCQESSSSTGLLPDDRIPIAKMRSASKISWMLTRRRAAGAKFRVFVTLWLLLAALAPLYSPWLNRDFAALQPEHDHIYWGKPNLAHHHQGGQKNTAGAGVTNVPNFNVGGGTAVPVLISLLFVTLLGPNLFAFLFKEPRLGINLIVLAPLGKPPRLAI